MIGQRPRRCSRGVYRFFLLFFFSQAEANHLEALRIRIDAYGENHESVAQSCQLLSLLLQSEGESLCCLCWMPLLVGKKPMS